MLNNIVDNLEQCGQQDIVHGCFHQARTGCPFFAVYGNKLKSDRANSLRPGTIYSYQIEMHFPVLLHLVSWLILLSKHV